MSVYEVSFRYRTQRDDGEWNDWAEMQVPLAADSPKAVLRTLVGWLRMLLGQKTFDVKDVHAKEVK